MIESPHGWPRPTQAILKTRDGKVFPLPRCSSKRLKITPGVRLGDVLLEMCEGLRPELDPC